MVLSSRNSTVIAMAGRFKILFRGHRGWSVSCDQAELFRADYELFGQHSGADTISGGWGATPKGACSMRVRGGMCNEHPSNGNGQSVSGFVNSLDNGNNAMIREFMPQEVQTRLAGIGSALVIDNTNARVSFEKPTKLTLSDGTTITFSIFGCEMAP